MNTRFKHILIFLFAGCLCVSCYEELASVDITYTITNKSGSPVTDILLIYPNPTKKFDRLENGETISYSFSVFSPYVHTSHLEYYINGEYFDVNNEHGAADAPDTGANKISNKVPVDDSTVVIVIYPDNYTVEIK